MNCVSTDAVATAVMGFDPMADRGTPPFEKCDSTLALAESLGVGTRDLKRIEVVGLPIAKAQYKFPPLSTLKSPHSWTAPLFLPLLFFLSFPPGICCYAVPSSSR